MPQFSVIIPAFNAAATIARTVECVLAQTSSDFEIIVVDDGSTDSTREVLERYAAQIRIVSQANRGLSAARNAGASLARARWLALLDADDTWTADKLEEIARALPLYPDAVMLFSDAICFDLSGTIAHGPFMPPQLAHAPSREEMMAGRFQILPSSAVIRRDTWERAGGFSEEFHGASGFEDAWFWLLLREQGPFAYLPARLVNYRVAPLITRLERYRPGFAIFTRLVRERYGVAGEPLIRARRDARVSLWARAGLIALAEGRAAEARYAFRNALRENPQRLKNLLRLCRTYLPTALARALTKSARDRASTDEPE
ncbi:MAG TPA: glycosyltransferase [Candidatus Binataceae bacterium]|nr:glycosyltransferase [Candidatus Binataceae bacterium]